LWDRFAKFHTMHLTKYFTDHWIHHMKSHTDYFARDNTDWKISVVDTVTNLVWKLFDGTMLLCLLISPMIFLSHYSGRKRPVLATCFSAAEHGHYQSTVLLWQNVASPTQPTVILWENMDSPSQQFYCGRACQLQSNCCTVAVTRPVPAKCPNGASWE
jgi:hypothetical protein